MDNKFDISTKKPGDIAWGIFRPAVTDPPDFVKLGLSTPVKGRLLRENEKDGIAFFTPLEPMHKGPLCYSCYALEHWLLADDEAAAWALRKELVFQEIARHKDEIVRLDALLADQPPEAAPGSPSRFKCRALSGNWCQTWQRPCVGWENCGLNQYGAPCPCCTSASPLDTPACADCCHKGWKQENYEPDDDKDEEE